MLEALIEKKNDKLISCQVDCTRVDDNAIKVTRK